MTASVATQALTTKARVHDVLVEEHTLVQDDSLVQASTEQVDYDYCYNYADGRTTCYTFYAKGINFCIDVYGDKNCSYFYTW